MNEQQVYIHIGMPRTATTFFQQEIFPNLPDFEFLGLEESHYSEPFNKLQFSDDSLYNSSDILALKQKWKKKNIILSNENFIGQSTHFNHINRSLIANRLKDAFPNAKILLVLRNQIDLLASLYAINLQWKEIRKIDDFIWNPFQEKSKDVGGPSTSYYNTLEGFECLDGYNYLPLINLYKSLFSNIEVLLFEDFIHNPAAFSKQLASFLEVDNEIIEQSISNQPKMNAGVSVKQAKKLTKLNKYSSLTENSAIRNRIYNKLKRNIIQSKGTHTKPFFSKEKENHLRNYFQKDNVALNAKYPELGLINYAKDYYLEQ